MEHVMTFGEALEALKAGSRVARSGWNGRGMWLALTPASEVEPSAANASGALRVLWDVEELEDIPRIVRIGAHIDMRAADGSLVIGWLASQTDMLSNDWLVL